MRHPHGSFLIILVLALLSLFPGPGATARAFAANCGDTSGPGGSDVPCACDDTVTTDTTLDDTDPVTSTVCSCYGLHVNRVTLGLGGHTIEGSGVCVGLNIELSGAVVGGGSVTQFGTGVAAFIEVGHTRVHNLKVISNTEGGIVLLGDLNVVEDCLASRNRGTGIVLIGDDSETPAESVVRRCRAEDNQGHGIFVGGNDNVVESNVGRGNTASGIVVIGVTGGNLVRLNRAESNGGHGVEVSADFAFLGPTSVVRNVARLNVGDGVQVSGEEVSLDQNRSEYNRGAGFRIDGLDHTIAGNYATANDRNGFTVSATGSTFDRNRSSYNDGWGIADSTVAGGAGGTANTYVGNRCTGDGLGDSSPPGLCF